MQCRITQTEVSPAIAEDFETDGFNTVDGGVLCSVIIDHLEVFIHGLGNLIACFSYNGLLEEEACTAILEDRRLDTFQVVVFKSIGMFAVKGCLHLVKERFVMSS